MIGFTFITLVDKIKDDKINFVSVLAVSRQPKYSGLGQRGTYKEEDQKARKWEIEKKKESDKNWEKKVLKKKRDRQERKKGL